MEHPAAHTPQLRTRTASLRDHLLLALLAVAGYWPLSFFLFSAKNDNIVALLPMRHAVSTALDAGELPLWSPYFFLGFPLHGDMQSGAWNPVVWLLSLFGPYRLTHIHAEILIYLVIAAWSMYAFLSSVSTRRKVRLAGAAAYLFCGYLTDTAGSNLQFLAGAAFVPLALHTFCRLLHRPSFPRTAAAAGALALLLLAAYPAFFILTAYILTALLMYTAVRRGSVKVLPWGALTGMALLFAAFCAPALCSYADLLPHYDRGAGLSLQRAAENSLHPYCTLSLLAPTAITRSDVPTDLISRNLFIATPLLLFLFTLSRRTGSRYGFLAAGILFFFLYSLGDATPVHRWSYHLLPLFNTFRHPSNARLFVLIGLLLLAARGLALWMQGARGSVLFAARAAALSALGLAVYGAMQTRPGFGAAPPGAEGRAGLKAALDSIGFPEGLLLNGGLQCVSLVFFSLFLQRNLRRLLVPAIIGHAFLFAQTTLPYTLVSQIPPARINARLNEVIHEVRGPDFGSSLEENSKNALVHYREIGIANFFNRRFGMVHEQVNPTFLNLLNALYRDTLQQRAAFRNPVAYLADSLLAAPPPDGTQRGLAFVPVAHRKPVVSGSFQVTGYTTATFRFQTTVPAPAFLVLQQSRLPGWKAFIDGRPAPIVPVNTAFMGVFLPPGPHTVFFRYQPVYIHPACWLTLAALLFTGAGLWRSRRAQNKGLEILP
ncbi:MAG TPA: YfhO family protein [Chitinophagaceae bacterium]|jgi:hypothetical protein|nr:YfhO family protein [Chitinophagaceae bacterium]